MQSSNGTWPHHLEGETTLDTEEDGSGLKCGSHLSLCHRRSGFVRRVREQFQRSLVTDCLLNAAIPPSNAGRVDEVDNPGWQLVRDSGFESMKRPPCGDISLLLTDARLRAERARHAARTAAAGLGTLDAVLERLKPWLDPVAPLARKDARA